METDQITNTEVIPQLSKNVKQKDPKKVAAGKALARKNAEARKSKKVEDDALARTTPEDVTTQINISTIWDGLVKISTIIGVGFTLYYLYTFINNNFLSKQGAVATASTPEVVTTPTIQNESKPKAKTSSTFTNMD